jgi:hypothetical protein
VCKIGAKPFAALRKWLTRSIHRVSVAFDGIRNPHLDFWYSVTAGVVRICDIARTPPRDNHRGRANAPRGENGPVVAPHIAKGRFAALLAWLTSPLFVLAHRFCTGCPLL